MLSAQPPNLSLATGQGTVFTSACQQDPWTQAATLPSLTAPLPGSQGLGPSCAGRVGTGGAPATQPPAWPSGMWVSSSTPFRSSPSSCTDSRTWSWPTENCCCPSGASPRAAPHLWAAPIRRQPGGQTAPCHLQRRSPRRLTAGTAVTWSPALRMAPGPPWKTARHMQPRPQDCDCPNLQTIPQGLARGRAGWDARMSPGSPAPCLLLPFAPSPAPRPCVPGPLRMLTACERPLAHVACACACGRLCGRPQTCGGGGGFYVSALCSLPISTGPRAGGRLHLSVTWFPVNMYVCMCVFAVVNTCPGCRGSYRSDC